MNGAYVYLIFRPNGIPCYVGKGHGGRWKCHNRRRGNLHLFNIYKAAGGNLPVVILHSGLSNSTALEYEIALIKAIGREENGGPLVNMTDGGEGTKGAKMTPEWRANRRQRAIEVWRRPEYLVTQSRKKIGNSNSKGQVHSSSWKLANAERMKGNTNTLGFCHSEESRAKMSAKRKGVPKSAAHRIAIGNAHRGMKRSPQARENMRLGHLRASI